MCGPGFVGADGDHYLPRNIRLDTYWWAILVQVLACDLARLAQSFAFNVENSDLLCRGSCNKTLQGG